MATRLQQHAFAECHLLGSEGILQGRRDGVGFVEFCERFDLNSFLMEHQRQITMRLRITRLEAQRISKLLPRRAEFASLQQH